MDIGLDVSIYLSESGLRKLRGILGRDRARRNPIHCYISDKRASVAMNLGAEGGIWVYLPVSREYVFIKLSFIDAIQLVRPSKHFGLVQ